jgi:hypothetical protein
MIIMKTFRSILISTSLLCFSVAMNSATADEIGSSCSFSGGVVKLAPGEAEKLFSGWAEQGHIMLVCNSNVAQSYEVSARREKTNGSIQLVNDKGEELSYLMHINGIEVTGTTPVEVLKLENGNKEQAVSLPLSVVVPEHKNGQKTDNSYANTVTLEVFVI